MNDLLRESKEFRILFKKSENLLAGKYFSLYKGDGIEFSDIREYCAGDDVRKIDWKVTAREGKAFVKEFCEERNANHIVVVDVSASCQNKLDEMKVLAVSLLLSSFKMQDAFSVVFYAKGFLFSLPLLKEKKHLMRCVYEISKIEPCGENDFSGVVLHLLNKVKRKSIISFVSDELEEVSSDVLKYLGCLKQKHKVLYFQVYDSSEKELLSGLEAYEDVESGEEFVYDLSEREILEYQKEYDLALKRFDESLKKIGVKVFPLDCKVGVAQGLKKNLEVL